MADDFDSIDDVLDDPSIDAGSLDAIAAALAGLTFLDPVRDVPGEPMPPEVWDRLAAALADEAAARQSPATGNVVPLVPRADRAEQRPPRAFRWAGGLAAASVAVFAVGLAVTMVGGGEANPEIVAGAAVSVRADSSSTAKQAPAPEGLSVAAPASAADSEAPRPARMVMASSINYTQAGLTSQVATLLDEVNVHTAGEASRMPVSPVTLPIEGGFTQSWDALRACLTWLAKSAQAQALVVDRATYEGVDAGVVVAPASQVDPATSPPPSTTVESSMGTLDVWVVKPECQQVKDGIMEHVPYALIP